MRLRLLHKSVDVLLMSLLIFSAGGLLFVYNRDVSSYALMALGLISILFLGKKMNRLIFKTSIITFMFFLLFLCSTTLLQLAIKVLLSMATIY